MPSLQSGLTPLYTAESPLDSPRSASPLNTHPMVIRSKVRAESNREPIALLTNVEPTNAEEALTIPQWKEAMHQEYNAFMANNTWTLVELPPNRRPISCKWVFRVKENPDGSINKFKARLVAKGFDQHHMHDYT